MAPVTHVCWKWHSPTYRVRFTPQHVNVWAAMIRRHHKAPCRLVCITDEPAGIKIETFPIWKDHERIGNPSGGVLPSCYRRLRIFDGETTRALGIEDGDRVVSWDLDVVVLGDVVPLFDRPDEFVGWKGIAAYGQPVYNGSLFMHRAGSLQWIWDTFDPIESPKATKGAKYYGSDQAWLSYCFKGSRPGCDVQDGVYSFARDCYRPRAEPAENARVVFFNGKRKPWEHFTQLTTPWISRHWRA